MESNGTLRVCSGSDIVPPDQLILLRIRFIRSKTDSTGSGLDLPIVDAMTKGGCIVLHLRSPATEHQDGFEAEIIIAPIARVDASN
ncbi:hypothetical protein J7J47_19165 [Halomonas sp. ISL-60]|nr:hypothetical protein [Halomonas sp. ISL-60]